MLQEYGSFYAITGGFVSLEDLVNKTEAILNKGIKIIQLRSKSNKETYLEEAQAILPLIEHYQAQLLLNTDLATWQQINQISSKVGLHLASDKAAEFTSRMIPQSIPLSMSVHNIEQLEQATKLQADVVLLSPVLPTKSHPELEALGWDKAQELKEQVSMPVFALGGVNSSHLEIARRYGFVGIAGIGAFWPSF